MKRCYWLEEEGVAWFPEKTHRAESRAKSELAVSDIVQPNPTFLPLHSTLRRWTLTHKTLVSGFLTRKWYTVVKVFDNLGWSLASVCAFQKGQVDAHAEASLFLAPAIVSDAMDRHEFRSSPGMSHLLTLWRPAASHTAPWAQIPRHHRGTPLWALQNTGDNH